MHRLQSGFSMEQLLGLIVDTDYGGLIYHPEDPEDPTEQEDDVPSELPGQIFPKRLHLLLFLQSARALFARAC